MKHSRKDETYLKILFAGAQLADSVPQSFLSHSAGTAALRPAVSTGLHWCLAAWAGRR